MKRYGFVPTNGGPRLDLADDGEWVRYDDANAALVDRVRKLDDEAIWRVVNAFLHAPDASDGFRQALEREISLG